MGAARGLFPHDPESSAPSELNLFCGKVSVSTSLRWKNGGRVLGGLGALMVLRAEHSDKSLGTQGLPMVRSELCLEPAQPGAEASLLLALAFL